MASQAMHPALLGHRRDAPDSRDLPFKTPAVDLPRAIDLRDKCGKPYDQGKIKSCSANALASVLNYLGNKDGIPIEPPSRLFMYYNERVLTGHQGTDHGSSLRDGIKAVAKQGACNEQLWPYDTDKVCVQPTEECYQKTEVRTIGYASIAQRIDDMKACLADGFPFVFGMVAHNSMCYVGTDGKLPMPTASDPVLGNHAVMAAGYDDDRKALVVLNSVGTEWGMRGYCYMPYAYATDSNLAYDFWTIRKLD
jgi:C1A family cysteine protease